MNSKRKIAIITGTRAEYGLLRSVIQLLHESDSVELQLFVTAMHLSAQFGLTVECIEHDGFPITEKVDLLLASDSAVGVTKSLGLGVISFAAVFERHKPDLLVVLGDRFETLAGALAAKLAGIAIAHIHGGELSLGAYDDAIRHCVTKLSALHFVATKRYATRVIQLGEAPDTVFHVGALGVQNIQTMTLLDKVTLAKKLNFNLDGTLFLATYHPVTLSEQLSQLGLEAFIQALRHFPNAKMIITYPNADVHSQVIIDRLTQFVASQPDRICFRPSLGHLMYLSCMQYASVVIGNSSSGLIEAPTFKLPTVNIGQRQAGRVRAASVLDVDEDKSAIIDAIHTALSTDFLASIAQMDHPYAADNTAQRIVDTIIGCDLEALKMKTFYDLGDQC